MSRRDTGEILKELAFVLLIFVLSFLPLSLEVLRGTPMDKEIETGYVNGLITASGIFLGFMSAAVISRGEHLEVFHYYLIKISFSIFFAVLVLISNAQFRGKVTGYELGFIQASVFPNGFAAFMIINRMLRVQLRISRG